METIDFDFSPSILILFCGLPEVSIPIILVQYVDIVLDSHHANV
jgi:hypothetical protein